MANIIVQGKEYNNVPAVRLPAVGGGSATFYESGGGGVTVEQLNVSAAGTYTAPTGTAYSPVVVPSGTEGTPTATKGAVSGNSVSVTPSVTNTGGYISGSTKTGTTVTVSASELVSGTKSITSSGTTDVTNYASANVPNGTEGTPVSTKGAVSNNSVSVTPSVTNTNGFINGGTHTGTAVTISASELVSGTKSITSAGTTDVTNYANASVPAGSVVLDDVYLDGDNVIMSASVDSSGLVTYSVGYQGYTDATLTSGYVSSYTSGGLEVNASGTLQLPTQAATTITPTTSSQTAVTSGKYTTGAITVDPIPSQYIVPTGTVSITSNGTVDVTQYASADVSIPATSTSYLGTNPVKIADYATQTVALSSTSFATWTPSTTYTTIYASSDVGTAVLDLANYNYNIVWFFDCKYVYDGTEVNTAKALRTCQCMHQSIFKNPNGLTALSAQNFNGNYCSTLFTSGLIDYYNTSSAPKLTYTLSVAAYLYATAATFSNSTSNTPTLTVKTPSIRFVCNNTYLSTANCAKIDKANTKFTLRGELWRVDKDSVMQGMYRNIVELYNS